MNEQNLELNQTARERNARRLRIFELALVLSVAFALSVFNSLYLLATGEKHTPQVSTIGVLNLIVMQATSLSVLFYVLFRQARSTREIGLTWSWPKLPNAVFQAIVLAFVAMWVSAFARVFMKAAFLATTGHKLDFQHEKLPVLAISIWTLLFIVLNGWFEELIVRAFVIVEIEFLTKNTAWAVAFSVLFQTSYHFYQGAPQALSYAPLFLVFSLFYVRTRNIVPVALAHVLIDLISVFALSHKR